MTEVNIPEPWLRGTLAGVPPVQRAVLHALELAKEDLAKWCGQLTDTEINARPNGLPSIAFHLRHIARSLDRLLTYAEGQQLNEAQLVALRTELDPDGECKELFLELNSALEDSARRVQAFDPEDYDKERLVGKKKLPTTVGSILVHIADHTQRHVGQAITTAKIVPFWRPLERQ